MQLRYSADYIDLRSASPEPPSVPSKQASDGASKQKAVKRNKKSRKRSTPNARRKRQQYRKSILNSWEYTSLQDKKKKHNYLHKLLRKHDQREKHRKSQKSMKNVPSPLPLSSSPPGKKSSTANNVEQIEAGQQPGQMLPPLKIFTSTEKSLEAGNTVKPKPQTNSHHYRGLSNKDFSG